MTNSRREIPPRVLAVSSCSALMLGLETLLRTGTPGVEWAGAIRTHEGLACAREFGAGIIVTDLDSVLGRECVCLLGRDSEVAIVALLGSASQELVDEAVRKGLRGVVPKQAPNEVLLKAIFAVHCGEHWLDRRLTSRILQGMADEGTPAASQLLNKLTRRERDVYHCITSRGGTSIRKLAEEMHISEHTLRNHLTAIYTKLHVSGRLELMGLASKIAVDDNNNHF
ncbi:MAG: response regulator transcription factor [Gammaproteobacteria bacterium]|nr:response regulator transcription factor [Gammaproteobacteria bacterium]